MKKPALRCMALLLCLLLTAGTAEAADGYDDHMLLGWKNGGTCTSLTGSTELFVVFVDVPEAKWNSDGMEACKATIAAAADALSADAAAHGVNLTFTAEYHTAEVAKVISLNDDSVSWAEETLGNAGLPLFACGEGEPSPYQGTPVLFWLNAGGRAFAYNGVGETDPEYLILYESATADTLRHELLHLYGAQDYYEVDALASAAEEYLPDSLMFAATGEHSVDSLAAYTIGWTNTLDASAVGFLQATEHVTREDVSAAATDKRITGYTTVIGDDYVYTGMMVDGFRHGWGLMEWQNGDAYLGPWEWGDRTGKGTFLWANGDRYSGDFVQGQCTGEGILQYANGDTYVGEMVDLKRTGEGVFTWANGTLYTGGFANDMLSGKGTYVWVDGSTYVGDFVEDKRTGEGVFTWADGSSYAGSFVDGLLQGYGTYTDANGTVYTGQWNNNQFVGK